MGPLALVLSSTIAFAHAATCASDLTALECAATVRQIKLEDALARCLEREDSVREELRLVVVMCGGAPAQPELTCPPVVECEPVGLSWAGTGLLVLGSVVGGAAAGLAGGLSVCK